MDFGKEIEEMSQILCFLFESVIAWIRDIQKLNSSKKDSEAWRFSVRSAGPCSIFLESTFVVAIEQVWSIIPLR